MKFINFEIEMRISILKHSLRIRISVNFMLFSQGFRGEKIQKVPFIFTLKSTYAKFRIVYRVIILYSA